MYQRGEGSCRVERESKETSQVKAEEVEAQDSENIPEETLSTEIREEKPEPVKKTVRPKAQRQQQAALREQQKQRNKQQRRR